MPMRFDLLAAVKISMMIFWVVTLCGLQVGPDVWEKYSSSLLKAEDGDNMFLLNVGSDLRDHKVLQSRKL